MKCLTEIGHKFYSTSDLHLNPRTLEILKSDQKTIVFGHIYHLPKSKTDDQRAIKSDIFKLLYFKSDLIMPTRHPSNLLQSWMHYAKHRSNKVRLKLAKTHDANNCSAKDISMLGKMHPLKQDAVRTRFNSRGKINGVKLVGNSPFISLKAEDEEYNLLKFTDHLKYTVFGGAFQLNAMSVQLYAPFWSVKQINEGKLISIEPPVSNEIRRVIYYDCENIDLKRQFLLDQEICPGFSERLANTRQNASHKECNKKGCEFDLVNKKLQSMIPSEWKIYAKSKELL